MPECVCACPCLCMCAAQLPDKGCQRLCPAARRDIARYDD